MDRTINIRHFLDEQGNPVAPFSPEAAIYDESGKRLSDKLKGLNLNSIREAQDKALSAIDEKENEAIGNFSSQRVIPGMLSPEVMALIEASGGGTINNMPDGEDLTSKNIAGGKSVMQLAGRPYNPSAFSGKGYAILRKNVSVLSRGGSANILTQEMISQPNTVYEVRYDFDLNGETVTIPEGCTIKFSGGCIKNGIIQGTDTLIEAGNTSILINVEFKGTFINSVIYSIWFGLIGEEKDGTENQIPQNNEQLTFEHIASFIRGCTSVTLEFENKVYGFGRGDFNPQMTAPTRLWYGYYALLINDLPASPIKLFSLNIKGNGASFINLYQYYVGLWEKVDGVMAPCYDSEKAGSYSNWTEGGGFIKVYSEKILNVQLKDFSVDMRRDILQYGGKQNASQSMNTVSIRTNGFIHLDDVHADNSITDGIITHGKSPFVYGTNVSCKKNGRCGWSILSGGVITVTSSKFSENGSTEGIPESYKIEDPGCNLNVEVAHYDYDAADYVNINHCVFESPRVYHVSTSGILNHVDIHDNVFIDKKNIRTSCIVSALKSAKIHHCIFINSLLKAPRILDNRTLSKETGGKGIVYDCAVYSDKITVPEGGVICSFGDADAPRNYNEETGAWDATTGVYSYSGKVYHNIDVFLQDKFQIAGSNRSDGYCSITGLKVHILEKRTIPVFSYWFNFSQTRNYTNKLTIYDYVLDEDITDVPSESYINNISNNIEIIKMANGVKPAVKIPDNISFYSQNTREGFERAGNKSVNLLKFISGYESIYMGFIHANMIKDIGTKQVISINKNPNNAHIDGCLFSMRKNKTSEADNTPTKGFDKFFGEIKGVPIKYSSNVEELKSSISEKGYSPIMGDMVYFSDYKKVGYYNLSSNNWLDANGNPVEAKDSGTFNQKPSNVKNGYMYFCTDRKTTEGNRNGIAIYYSGSNTWVDALGRVIE